MNTAQVLEALRGLPLGGVRYYDKTASTNTGAAGWAEAGAPHLALVLADEQTAGRGRLGRKWLTPPGAALAFSLVLRTCGLESTQPDYPDRNANRFTALGALAVSQALRRHYGLAAQIKWPNDVLLEGRKTAGVLAEAHWHGERLAAVILGIGVNVTPASLPSDEQVNFPATCVEAVLGEGVPRLELLRQILAELLAWRERIGAEEFIQSWDEQLAMRGEWVEVRSNHPSDETHMRTGRVLGLDSAGRLRLQAEAGEVFTISTGEIHRHALPMSGPISCSHFVGYAK